MIVTKVHGKKSDKFFFIIFFVLMEDLQFSIIYCIDFVLSICR